MHTLRVGFANIYQGLVFEGKKNNTDVFSKFWPSVYQDQYLALHPDVLCLAEVPLDDEHGNSTFLDSFAEAMGAVSCRAHGHEKSWVVEGKYYGNAILSKFDLSNYHALQLPNPHLEVDRPDGSHWVMHDKSVQSAVIHVGDSAIRLFNLHYFPFHHFKRNMSEAEFQSSRNAFIEQLRLSDGVPTILTGDFNNNDDELEIAYPELFEDGVLETAVRFGPEQFDEYYNGQHQMDHVLYTPQDFSVLSSQIIRDPSDHRGIITELEMRP